MTALVILMAVVMALLVILVAGLLRSHGEILRRLHALDGGESDGARATGLEIMHGDRRPAPLAIAGVDPAGNAVSVSLSSSRGVVLLAFLSSGCLSCRGIWEALGEEPVLPGRDVRLVAVTKGPAEESPSAVGDLAPAGHVTVMSSEAWDDFAVPGSPYFALVDAEQGSLIGEGAAGSWDQVVRLMDQALADAGRAGENTAARSERVGRSLDAAGVEPGDSSLYRNPHEEAET